MHPGSLAAPVKKQLSLRSVMEIIIHQGPISRARIAKITGLSKQTVSEAMRELEAAGWVLPCGEARGPLGRSAVNYEINKNAAFVMGADLGGTKLHLALADLSGATEAEDTEPTDPRGGQHIIDQIGSMMRRLADQAGIDAGRVQIAVIGSPGVLDPATGRVAMAPNIPGFGEMDVVAALHRTLGVKVVFENDVNLWAVGEHWQGSGKGLSSFAFIALGTGIGMGLFVDGRLLHGARGAAGEVSYLPIGADPFTPESVRAGTLERAIGSAGIVDSYRATGGKAATVREIFDAYRTGDPTARTVVEATARTLALAVAATASIIDPALVIFGGSIGTQPELIDATRLALGLCMARPLPIAISGLGNRGAIIGALAIGLNQIHNSLFHPADLPGNLTLPDAEAENQEAAE